jgi:hypothetical protein
MNNTESEFNNLYGTFNGNKNEIANEFEKNGWKKRKCTWVDYEIKNEWSEIIIEGNEPDCLLNGYFKDIESHLDDIIRILSKSTSNWSLEIYNNENVMIKKVVS